MSRELRHTLDLFSNRSSPVSDHPELRWPDANRFPLNLHNVQVSHVVRRDLAASDEPLIVTGYAGLDQIIDFAADCKDGSILRVAFGSEPFRSRKETFQLEDFSFEKEVESYWLQRGISLFLSAKLILTIRRLESGNIRARYVGNSSTRLHAKIYCTEEAATVGSSNFTRPGMESQLEANARFTRKSDSARFRELRSIAENYWNVGRDYNQELIELLRRLLCLVKWREALARACAELLEGDWAHAYLRREYLPDEGTLWPSQRQGIAQALYVLTRQGSVLIADATGSGKTRSGVHLIGAVADHNLRAGRKRRGKSLIVCPPAVMPSWTAESQAASIHLDVFSHGILSQPSSRKQSHTLEALRRAQILGIDEGHNFLNISSTRTKRLLCNMADYVLLFTATPINRSVVDLLRIADMLGADNLADSTLNMFKRLLAAKNIDRSLEEEEVEVLRKEIKRFTVRRTKRVLNRLIDREPAKYVNRNGRQCRFPQHKPKTYRLNESEEDRRLAAEIRALVDQLYAVARFQNPIEMPEVLRRRRVSEETFLHGRLSSAQKIARFLVMKLLRSSRHALAEHIAGTKKAMFDFDLAEFKKHTSTGDVLSVLQKIRGSIPKNCLSIDLPEWLSDPVAHKAACEHDRALYQRMYDLLKRMTNGRAREKAALLIELVSRGNLVLAFDSSPVSLAAIRKEIGKKNSVLDTVVATGDAGSDRTDALEIFALGSTRKRVIGLCSDSLAEGVNLQQAAALVHLDMPSVVRVAEQRVGRIDRLDSPHKAIEVWWPVDAEEFALSSDERFIERYETVDALLGSNLPLPESMRTEKRTPVAVHDLIKEYEEQTEAGLWDGIQDAFEPVRAIVDGPAALIENRTYEHYRKVVARIRSRVSLVKGDKPWAFFCLAGGEFDAPRWLLIPGLEEKPVAELERICEVLRIHLTVETEDVPMTPLADHYLKQFIARLAEAERELLPTKKRRAIDEMQVVLEQYLQDASSRSDQIRVDAYRKLLDALTQGRPDIQPDWDEIASRWLDLIRPIWYERLKEHRSRPLLLRDIRRDLLKAEDSFGDEILSTFQAFPILQQPDERISACILGVPRG